MRQSDTAGFELSGFTPYLLNLAAEAQGEIFSKIYRERYGMLRTEWRVLFHLGRYGELSAKEISDRALIHKTKVSRAVRALEEKRFLERFVSESDRRVERLVLRAPGREAFAYLSKAASNYETRLQDKLGAEDAWRLREILKRLVG